MPKHQIISINRSTEPSPQTEATLEAAPEPTLESKSEGKKIISVPGSGGDRPQRQPTGQQRRGGFKPRQPEPEFLAHGLLRGHLSKADGKLVFTTHDGYNLHIAGLDSVMAITLLASDWEEDERIWLAYPQTPRHRNAPISWFLKAYGITELQLEVDQFRIWCSGGKYTGTVFVGRSDPQLKKRKQFTILPIDNAPELPEQKPAKWLCHREGDRLVYIGEDTLPHPPGIEKSGSLKGKGK